MEEIIEIEKLRKKYGVAAMDRTVQEILIEGVKNIRKSYLSKEIVKGISLLFKVDNDNIDSLIENWSIEEIRKRFEDDESTINTMNELGAIICGIEITKQAEKNAEFDEDGTWSQKYCNTIASYLMDYLIKYGKIDERIALHSRDVSYFKWNIIKEKRAFDGVHGVVYV